MKLTVAVALVVVLLGVSMQSGQPAPGAIEGVVVGTGTDTPIVNARVTALPPGGPPAGTAPPPPPPTATTDATGRFVFDGLPPGAYRLMVVADGYVRRTIGPAEAIEVVPGQTVRGVRVSLQPTGIVSGRVLDPDGRPLAGIPVQLLQPSYDWLGGRTLRSANTAMSDDRGEYRVHGVTPGRYYVQAGAGPVQPRTRSPNAPAHPGILPTYYPNADLDGAMALDVLPGAERGGTDFVVERQPLRRITGRVLDAATGAPPEAAQISLVTQSGAGTTRRGPFRTYNPADGTFELRDVPAGRHHVIAEIVATGVAPPPMTFPVMPAGVGGAFTGGMRPDLVTASAHVPIDVSRADAEDLTIVVTAAFPVRGHVTLSGGASVAAFDRLQVQLTSLRSSLQVQAPQPARVASDGSFEISHVLPGEYRVQTAGLQPDFYLESAHAGAVDVATTPLEIAGAMADALDIVVSARVSTIDGAVTDARGQPVPGARVVLVPIDRPGRLDRFSVAPSGPDGRFEVRGVAPGEYRLFAAERVDPFAFLDPDVAAQHESQGRTVSVSAASRQTVQVRFIPAEP